MTLINSKNSYLKSLTEFLYEGIKANTLKIDTVDAKNDKVFLKILSSRNDIHTFHTFGPGKIYDKNNKKKTPNIVNN